MDVEKIVWSKEVTEEQKEWFKQHLAWHAKQQERLCVIYHPNCGCSIDSFVVLDRFPMSEKIIACQCPECKNYCTMEISDPIKFHLPLLNQDYTIEELSKMHVTDSDQKDLIQAYIHSYLEYNEV